MNWDKLSQVRIENKERFQDIFSETVKQIQNNEFPINPGEIEKEDYYIVTESNRMNGYFVHIVPKQVYVLFKEMQESDQFLGFSVVAGKKDNKDVRVSCFGVPCNILGKSLFEDYKSKTKRMYDKYAAKFDEQFREHFQQRVEQHAELFLRHFKGKSILDLGSGPGNHAEFFQKRGFDVLCVDISEEMVAICRKKGLNAQVMDIENLPLENSYDGIWAYASLLHIPKERIQRVIEQLVKILRPNGLLGIALKEGEGQGLEAHEKYPDTQRWFTYYTDEEVRKLFGKWFDVIHASRDNVGNRYVFLNHILRKRAE